MAKFDLAIPFILNHEGGFAKTPAGEVVNRGINVDTLKSMGVEGTDEELAQKVEHMTEQEARDIYHKRYWRLPENCTQRDAMDLIENQQVANKLLDMFVLRGHNSPIRLLQEILHVKCDGDFGPKTLAALNLARDTPYLMGRICHLYKTNLTLIAESKIQSALRQRNEKLAIYWRNVKKGWIARAEWPGLDDGAA